MSDQDTTVNDQDTTQQDTPEQQEPAIDQDTTGDERVKAARSEAAKYRTRLREAEAQRDEVTARYEGLLRTTIEAAAQQHHHTPAAALWDSGVTAGELLDDDGAVDPAKLRTACDAARARYGITRPAESPAQGTNSKPANRPTWHTAFRGE